MSISAAELALIQADVQAIALDKTCTIERASLNTSDTYGSPTKPSYSTIATVMAGLAEPTAGQLQNYDYLIGSLAAWQVKLPVGTDIQHQDHLLIDGQTLEVHVILTPRSYATLLTVIAAEVK